MSSVGQIKRRWTDLALFGGQPCFDERVCIGTPNIPDRVKFFQRVSRALTDRWLSNNGPFVRELEQRTADLLGVRNCVATCNGTVGLEIAARALGLAGDVIVPSFTYVATAHALKWLGISPVFCDVDRKHNLSPAAVSKLITPRTAAILGVHLWGRPCDVEALSAIASHAGIPLILDAAHAFGCSHRGRMIGAFGRLEVFSFHATKVFHTFEGGAITTNDDALATTLRTLRDLGFASQGNIVSIGTNGKMNEVCAAMGLTCLDNLDDIVAWNYRNYKHYEASLSGIKGVQLQCVDESERNNYHYIVVEVDETIAGVNSDEIQRLLLAENVITKRYFHPGCHRLEPYRKSDGDRNLPQTDELAHRVLALPNGTAIQVDQVSIICELIRFVTEYAGDITCRLSASQKQQKEAVGVV